MNTNGLSQRATSPTITREIDGKEYFTKLEFSEFRGRLIVHWWFNADDIVYSWAWDSGLRWRG